MMTSAIQPVLQTAGADTTTRMMERTPSFASAIARVGAGTREKQINEAAQQLVATSLVQPVLDSMMKSRFREGRSRRARRGAIHAAVEPTSFRQDRIQRELRSRERVD